MELIDAPHDCARCPRLCASRKLVINGTKGFTGGVLIVVSGPGKEEETQGHPLSVEMEKRVGYLLNRAGVDPGIVQIELITRCRPPRLHGEEQPPTLDEIQSCSSFLLKGISQMNPFLIVALGARAWRWFNQKCTPSEIYGNHFIWTHPETGVVMNIVPMHLPDSASEKNLRLVKTMIIDWKYLGEVLIGKGEEAKTEYIKQCPPYWVSTRPDSAHTRLNV